jgi:hypothetical protein
MYNGPHDAHCTGANIRTGGPGETSLVKIGSGVLAKGHKIDSVSLSFRYAAGYTPGAGKTVKAATVSAVLLDMATGKVLKTIGTTPPLGNYSFDHFTTYSPPQYINATGLGVPNDTPVILALQISNNARNLQVPIDDKSNGFGAKLSWTSSFTAPPAAPRAAPPAAAAAAVGGGDKAPSKTTFTFSRGGIQGGEGVTDGENWYIENVLEELVSGLQVPSMVVDPYVHIQCSD